MKTKKMYQVRVEKNSGESSKIVGFKMKLVERSKAIKIVKFLKRRKVNAFYTPVTICV